MYQSSSLKRIGYPMKLKDRKIASKRVHIERILLLWKTLLVKVISSQHSKAGLVFDSNFPVHSNLDT